MNLILRQALAATLVAWFATAAYAQVCREQGGSGAAPANMNCDMRYRNTEVACDSANVVDTGPGTAPVTGTRPACPKKPMPMIDTPKASYSSDYTKYLYIYPRDSRNVTAPYAGPYTTGTPGDASRTFQMFGNTAPGTKRLASCTTQLLPPQPLADDDEWARFIRLQIDNCTNQYILNTAASPFQKENPASSRLLTMDADPFNPASNMARPIDLESECQPLRMTRPQNNEYSPSEYLALAWRKTLQEPGYRKTTPNLLRCVPCITENIPCDREPHLPCSGLNQGIVIENPLPLPPQLAAGNSVTLANLSAVPYEEILDPTHPYSPRWDYLFNDRDYSTNTLNLVNLSGGSGIATMAALRLLGPRYMTQSYFNSSTYCAGIKQAPAGTPAARRRDLEVKVDVLEFRRSAYERALNTRMLYNTVCREWRGRFTTGGRRRWPLIVVAPASFCYRITGFSLNAPYIFARDFDCWECYGLFGRVDGVSRIRGVLQQAPCSHNYIEPDLRMRRSPGGLNGFSRRARCGRSMQDVCRDLRAPLVPLNKLKMRYHNPNDPNDPNGNNLVLKDAQSPNNDGALEGLSFNDYFGNHMPYMKIWDMGQSLQRTRNSDGTMQPPNDTTGQYTTIVGVGREAAATVASNAAVPLRDANNRTLAERYTDQRCKTMGWSGVPKLPINFGGLSVYPPDPMTSWTELKLYQARTTRNVGLTCLARYEKVFKPGSAENLILMATGGEWDRTIISRCARAPGGRVRNCTYMTLQEYQAAGSPANTNTVVYLKQLQKQAWPNSWRGYMAAENPDVQFPNFGDMIASTITGLDEAEPGDVILLPEGPRGPAIKPGLAKLALVTEVRLPNNSTCVDDRNCYVKVLEPDTGKWPDICGTTDTWGEMKARYYFRPGHLPTAAAAEYERIGSASHCGEVKLSQCEQRGWDDLELYRIRTDERPGCDRLNTSECARN